MIRKKLSDYPLLLKEWDYEKNKGVDPNDVLASTHDKMWWKCQNGHSWFASVSNRTSLNRGCPYCSHQLPIVGETDFATLFPDLLKELSPDKNPNLDPSKTMPGTHKEAWWICPKCGNEYKMRIYHRTIGMGCPVCAHKKIVKGVNDFGTRHPKLLKEWDFNKNTNVSPYEIPSNYPEEVWWICPIGHEYKAKVAGRSYGRNCPICQKAHRTSFPEQAILFYVKKYFPDAVNSYKDIFKNSMELDVYIPSIKVGIEYDGLAWHSTKSNIERDIRKYNICKKNDIFLIRVRECEYKEEIKTCDLLLILKDTKSSKHLDREIYHVLECITSFSPNYMNYRMNMLLNPPNPIESMKFNLALMDVDVARDRHVIQSYLGEFEGSLAKYRPDLIEEWDYEKNKPLTPYNVKLNCNERVWWKCKKCGHEWKAAICERGGHDKTNCPLCANTIGGRKHHEYVLKQKGSIVETHPHILYKWDYELNKRKPDEYTAGSGESVWWKCPTCGYSWKTTICHMTSRNSGCPVCLNKICLPGYNDIATKHPELILDWDYDKNYQDPTKITTGGYRVFWKCHICGHEWSSLISGRAKGVGCPKCAINRRVGNKFAKKM